MNLFQTVCAALGGEFVTQKTQRSSYDTNGTHTVRALRNGNVQVEFHDLKTGNSINFIEKGRLGAQAHVALTEAGIPEASIQVSDGSYDNRGGQTGVWRAWPSLYVQNNATAGASAADKAQLNAVKSELAAIKAMLAKSVGTEVAEAAANDVDVDADGDGTIDTPAPDTDF